MKVSFGMYWQSYGRQILEIPDEYCHNPEDYIRDHWDDVPLPEGDYVMGSDELDYDSICIEEMP